MKKLLYISLLSIHLFSSQTFDLQTSISKALENNEKQKISQISLEIAKVQYEQSRSANYPSLNLNLMANRLKDNVMFDLKGNIPLDLKTTKALAYATAGSLGGSAVADAFRLSPAFTNMKSGTLPMDMEQEIAGRDSVIAQLELKYPLYTGGKITSIQNQARLNKLLARTSIIRVQNDVIYDVKQYFYAYQMASKLYTLSLDVYTRMKNLENLTKQFLEEGDSLKIKKTDYLNMQVTVALISSKVSEIEIKKELAKSALMNVIGLKYNDEVEFSFEKNDIKYNNTSLEKLIKEAHDNNIDLKKVDYFIKIYDEKIKEKQASHYPDVIFIADTRKGYNSYKDSYLNDDSWSISLLAKIPLFSGFKTSNEIKEKKLEKQKIIHQQKMLKDGISTLVKNEFIKSSLTYKQIQTLKKAIKISIANRKLNTRAYRVEAVTPKEVIEAQLTEAYVKIDYEKYVHDYLLSLARIEKLISINIIK